MLPIVGIVGAVIGICIAVAVIRWWVVIYNKFIYWKTKAERKFADIDVIMEQLVNMNMELTNVVKKYDIHEYKTLQNTIEARSRWSRNADINAKVRAAQEVENNFLKIQAVFERYPKLKADALHMRLLGRGNISDMYYKLSHAKRGYNYTAQQYNQRVRQFPRSIVANASGFRVLDYYETAHTKFTGAKKYNPKGNFDDEEG